MPPSRVKDYEFMNAKMKVKGPYLITDKPYAVKIEVSECISHSLHLSDFVLHLKVIKTN